MLDFHLCQKPLLGRVCLETLQLLEGMWLFSTDIYLLLVATQQGQAVLKDLYAGLYHTAHCSLLRGVGKGGKLGRQTVVMSRRRPDEGELTGDNDWYHQSMDEGRGRK